MEQEQKTEDNVKKIPEICPDAKYRMEMLKKRYLPNKIHNTTSKEQA